MKKMFEELSWSGKTIDEHNRVLLLLLNLPEELQSIYMATF